MTDCKYCGEELPILKIRRTWKEKNITCRNKAKYKCNKCNKITLIVVR
ncbi:MAG: hypothetical protein ACJAZP_000171 [Psychromonas sp.]|jgi:hypothetical protein